VTFIDQAVDHYGRLDFLLANAGIADQGLAAEADPAVQLRLIETNLLVVMYCVRDGLELAAQPRLQLAVVQECEFAFGQHMDRERQLIGNGLASAEDGDRWHP